MVLATEGVGFRLAGRRSVPKRTLVSVWRECWGGARRPLRAWWPDTTETVVRLCDFADRGGDLDLRFTPEPTAREGVEGHRRLAARRGAGCRAEYAFEGER